MVLKSRDITLLTKVHIVKAMVFLAIMYRYKGCTIKKAEHWRNDAFKVWRWRRLLRVLWRSNQSFLKEINPEYSLKGLNLKLQYLGHLIQTAVLLEKTLMLGKFEGKRRQQQRIRRLDGITDSMDMNLSKFLEIMKHKEARHVTVLGVTKSQTWHSDWTERMVLNPRADSYEFLASFCNIIQSYFINDRTGLINLDPCLFFR